ncbi:hypothetical protein AB0I53_28820 [Saccharopolyspora sp. NPDC050389]|uniref:hypothetical protein n=1 Tax=Saccharopolyspora sp. NPDC050389 TaxID=3155516 RepID=UPI00340C1EEE
MLDERSAARMNDGANHESALDLDDPFHRSVAIGLFTIAGALALGTMAFMVLYDFDLVCFLLDVGAFVASAMLNMAILRHRW